jgi:hypothetical protein
VPPGLARLVHLEVVNLDGNPLAGRLAGGGPTLREVWDDGEERGGAAAGGSGGDDGRGGDDNEGGGRGDAQLADARAGAPEQPRSAAAHAAAGEARLRRRTARLMQHLQALQVTAQARARDGLGSRKV